MKSISKRYSDIFNKYYAKTAKSRFKFFIGFIDSWMSKITIGSEFVYIVDHERLSKTIDSYFLDVIKYKEYHFNATNIDDIYSEAWCKEIHENHKINDSKVAAFTAKWLLKAAPISIIPGNISSSIRRPENDNLCHINERFALDCALYSLFRDSYLNLDDDSYESLYYDFKYRNFDERAYFSRFRLLLKLVKERELKITTHENIKIQEQKKTPITVDSKEEIKIFIASADDVKDLRKATIDTIKHLNLPSNRKYNLIPWMWEQDKNPGHLDNDEQYQNEVFQEFGKHCDVFILLFWAKLGEGTIKEYDYFKKVFKQHNPNIKFFACEYGKKIDHKQAEGAAKLNTWLDKENKYWAPIGGVRKSITSIPKYKESLNKHLLELILDLN